MTCRSTALGGPASGCCGEGCAPNRAFGAVGGIRTPEAVAAIRKVPVRHWRNKGKIRQSRVRVNIVVSRFEPSSDRLASRNCPAVPRASVVNARRPGPRPGRSEAESIDDAEHGAIINDAMVVPFDVAIGIALVLLENFARARTDFCRMYRHTFFGGIWPRRPAL